MARQIKRTTTKRRLCLDDIEIQNILSKKDSTTIDDQVAANTQKDNPPKGYKLRGPSNIKYVEEHDSEDFSPECSEYVLSPERLLPSSRSTSSLDVDSQMQNLLIKNAKVPRLQENEIRSASSLGGDSHIIDNLLDHETFSRPPSTVSNLSSILGETCFVASSNVIYISPRQNKKKKDIPFLRNKEKYSSGLGDIFKSQNQPQPRLSDYNTKNMDNPLTDEPNETFTSGETQTQDTTLTNLATCQEQKTVEVDIKEDTTTYEIEITIELESPEDNVLELWQENDKSEEQNIQEITYTKETETKNLMAVEDNQEIERNDKENTDPLDLMNQTPEETSILINESEKQRPLEIPVEIISVEESETVFDKRKDDNSDNESPDISLFDQELEHDCLSRPQTPTQAGEPLISDDIEQARQLPNSEIEHENQTIQLTRKRKRNTSEWKDNKCKKSKNTGREYEGARSKKHYPKKTVLSSCNCKKTCGDKFNDELRQSLHTKFYELANREYQWQYISRHVKAEDVKKITVIRKNNRTQTYKYFFPLDDKDVQVCKVFFLNTLSITEQMIYTSLQKVKSDESMVDRRGLHLNRPHRMKPSTEASIKAHIEIFPKIESHYIRNDSKRQYLDETLNISKMYRLYKSWFAGQNYSNEDDVKMATKRQYERIFNTEYNLSFFQPKKDQCFLCSQFQQAGTVEKAAIEEKYNKHIKMKNRVREIKNEEKTTLNKEDTVLAIFDLQKVIQVPRSEVSVFHYKRKYPVYDFTVFDALNKQGFCYVWHAEIGKKGCIEIGSCLLQFIRSMYEKGVRKFVFYSDGCYGQNKNRYIFALYLYIAMTMKVEITHRFFVGGHSQNEGDSMHACIERALKNKVVYTPDQVYNIITNAKVSGDKYTVKEIDQSEIYDIKELVEPKRWQQDRTGEKVRWSDIMEVHVSHNLPNRFLFKYDYDNEYSELDFELATVTRGKQGRRRAKRNDESTSKPLEGIKLKPAYNNLFPITKALYDDLQSLCNSQAIPRHYHGFFNNLIHSTSADSQEENNDD